MDEEMDGFYRVEAASLVEYDPNYEFDAPRYYDFCRMETDWDVEEAERWFDAARTYPPSRMRFMPSFCEEFFVLIISLEYPFFIFFSRCFFNDSCIYVIAHSVSFC